MKVLERVLEKRIRCQVSIENMQFGFMPGQGTTDAIFIMRQVQEKHQAKKKKMYYAFVDLEKTFDKSPKRGGEMGLAESGYGRVAHLHSYGIVYRGLHCS